MANLAEIQSQDKRYRDLYAPGGIITDFEEQAQGFIKADENAAASDAILAEVREEQNQEQKRKQEFVFGATESNLARMKVENRVLAEGEIQQPITFFGSMFRSIDDTKELEYKYTEDEARKIAARDAESIWAHQGLKREDGPSPEQAETLAEEEALIPTTGPLVVATAAGTSSAYLANSAAIRLGTATLTAGQTLDLVGLNLLFGVATIPTTAAVDAFSEDHPYAGIAVGVGLGLVEGTALRVAGNAVKASSNSLTKGFTRLFKGNKTSFEDILRAAARGDMGTPEARQIARTALSQAQAKPGVSEKNLITFRQAIKEIDQIEAIDTGLEIARIPMSKVLLKSDGDIVLTENIHQAIASANKRISSYETSLERAKIEEFKDGTVEAFEQQLGIERVQRIALAEEIAVTRSKNQPKLFNPKVIRTTKDAYLAISKVLDKVSKRAGTNGRGRYPFKLEDKTVKSLKTGQSVKIKGLNDTDYLRLGKSLGLNLSRGMTKAEQLDATANYLQKTLGAADRSYAKNGYHMKILATLDTLRAEADRLKGTPFADMSSKLYIYATDIFGQKDTLNRLTSIGDAKKRGWEEIMSFQHGDATDYARDFPGESRTGITNYESPNKSPVTLRFQEGLTVKELDELIAPPKPILSIEEEVEVSKQVSGVLQHLRTRVTDPFISATPDGVVKFNQVRINSEADIDSAVKALDSLKDYTKVTTKEVSVALREMTNLLGQPMRANIGQGDVVRMRDFVRASQKATQSLAERAAKPDSTVLDQIAFKKQLAITQVITDRLTGTSNTDVGNLNLGQFKSYTMQAENDMEFLTRMTDIVKANRSELTLQYDRVNAEMYNALATTEQATWFPEVMANSYNAAIAQEAASVNSKDLNYVNTKIKDNTDAIRSIVREKCI